MNTFSPIFRKSLDAIPIVLRRKFGFPETGNPNLSSNFYNSREAIVRAIDQSGDPKNVLPFVGIKLTAANIDVESYHKWLLKNDGIPLYYNPAELADDNLSVMTFFGRAVAVEADCIFFSDSFDEIISMIEQIMFSGSELHFKLRIGEGNIPIRLSINKDSISVPEADFTTEVPANFELNFQITVKTYSGFIEPVPLVKRIKIQGGTVIEFETLAGEQKKRIDRMLSSAFGVNTKNFVDDMGIVEFDIDLDTDIIDPSQVKES